MTDQDTKPTRVEIASAEDQTANSQKVWGELTRIVFLVIIAVIAGIALLALLGPTVGNVYSYAGSAL